MTAEDLAKRAAAQMMSQDSASQALGITLVSVAPGDAVMQMQVRPDMLNGHGICHGGLIFTLADSAFAFACNSRNQIVVAQSNQITYLSPAQASEVLTASAREVARAGRSGTYDVTVTGEDGRVVALFRGLSRQLEGKHVSGEEST